HAALERSGVASLASEQRACRRCVIRLQEAMQPLLRGGGARVEGERDICGAGDGVGFASRDAGGLADARAVLDEELDVGAGREPGVEAGGLAQGRRPTAADPDWWTTGTMWLRLHGDVVEREVLAAEADVIAAPQRSTDLERLEKAPDATLEWHADGLELLPDGRGVRGNADAEDHAALGDAIQRADDVGYHHRSAERGE